MKRVTVQIYIDSSEPLFEEDLNDLNSALKEMLTKYSEEKAVKTDGVINSTWHVNKY